MPNLGMVLAPNPGPMTLDGTNTWLLGDRSRGAPTVVDPGPLDEAHLGAVLALAGGRIAMVLLTHRHADHSEAATELAARAGCGVRAVDPGYCAGADPLVDGEVVAAPGVRIRTVLTPGHTSDSCCFLAEGKGSAPMLLTGDTVLGRGTTVITRPDGDLAAYLESLDRLDRLITEAGVGEILPGHGPRLLDPAAAIAGYRAHRQERLGQVRAARAAGARTPAEIVARVYADVDRAVWPAAEQSVAAQLAYLEATEDG